MSILSNFRAAAALSLAAIVGLSSTVNAQDSVGVVSNVKVLSNHVDDVSSVEAWKKSFIKDGMSDQEKAIAIFNTVVKYRHQASPPQEGLQFQGCVHDPIKSYNVYGYGQCCCASGNVAGLARYLGMRARGRIINAHSVPEVSFDEGKTWHLIDGSVMNYFVKDDGTLASVDDIRAAVRGWMEEHPELRGKDSELRKFAKNEGWKNGPALLAKASDFYGKDGVNSAGWHGWMSTMQEYDWSDDKATVYEYGTSMGYQVNVQLRPGEKITRNWFSKSIEDTNKTPKDYYSALKDRKQLGIQTKLGDKAPGRIGSGNHVWDLPLGSPAMKATALTFENLTSGNNRVTVTDPSQPGVLVVRVPSNYVLINGELSFTPVISSGGNVTVSFSDNNGLDWKELAKVDSASPQKISMKEHIFRRYDYRLKFELSGAGTGLEAAKIDNLFQCSQAALPTIVEGENTITFTAGPQEGTVTIEGAMDPAVAKKAGQVSHLDFKPQFDGLNENSLKVGETGTGSATYKVAAPGDIKRIRFNSTYRARDARDKYEVTVSFDSGNTFVPMGILDQGQPGSSRYLVFGDVPAGTREALVKLTASQKNTLMVFDLRIDADYAEPNGGFKPVKVTYVWDEGGKEKTDVHVAKSPEETYKITAGPKAVVKSYTVELAE